MSMIESTTGGVTTRAHGSMTIQAFYRRSKDGEEAALHEAERDARSDIKSLSGVEVTPSGRAATNLKWVNKRNEYPEGCYIRINIHRSNKNGLRMVSDVVNVFIRPRSSAPLYDLAISLPADEHSSRTKAYFHGRFDILSLEEAEELGLFKGLAKMNGPHSYTELESDDCPILSAIVKEKGTAPLSKPSVTTIQAADGSKKSVARLAPRRNLRLSR